MSTIDQTMISAMRKLIAPVASRPVNAVRGSRFYFDRFREQFFRSHPIESRDGTESAELDELLRSGVLVLPGYFSSGKLGALREQSLTLMERVRTAAADEVTADDKVLYADDGIYRVRNAQRYVPDLSSILEDKHIGSLARTYMHFPISRIVHYLDYKPDAGVHDHTSIPHMDGWLPAIKVFTLLYDVTLDNAPMVFWKRSHRDRPWRHHLDYFNWADKYGGSSGICPPHLLDQQDDVRQPEKIEKQVLTGPAGTVVIADTRAIHRASILNKGFRLQLVQKYIMKYSRSFIQTLLDTR